MSNSVIVAALIAGQVQQVDDPVAITEAVAAGRVEFIGMAATTRQGQTTLERALASKPNSPVFIIELPLGDDPGEALAGALATYELSCGLLANPLGPDRWQLAAVGACVQGSSSASNLDLAATTPAPDQPLSTESPTAVISDPSVLALAAATAPEASTVLEGPPTGGTFMVGTVLELVDHLVEQPDHEIRIDVLTDLSAQLGDDPDLGARLGQAMAVLSALERSDRNDLTVVRLFLRAALCDQAEARSAALRSASDGGDPPMVADEALGLAFAQPVASELTIELPPLFTDRSPLAMAYKEYHRKRMVRGTTAVRFDRVGRPIHDKTPGWKWMVYRGRTSLSPQGFAREIGDRAMLARLENDTKQVRTISNVLFGIVGVAAVAQIGVMAKKGVDFVEEPSILVLPAAVIAPALPWAIVMPIKVRNDQQWIFNYYSKNKAIMKIRKHNDELQEELGITDEQMKELDTRE